MLALLLMLADEPAAVLAAARARLQVERPCVVDPNSTDITVCGLRHADRFRVPFTTSDPGDPKRQPVFAERERLLHRTNPVQELSPFLVGGGMAGVSATVGGNGKVQTTGLRRLAP